MQKLLKKSKKLLIASLSVLVASSCSLLGPKVPPPPNIQTNMHDVSSRMALCSDTNGVKCEPTPMEKTDGWIMFSPEAWEKAQNYMDLLACIAEGGCKSPLGNVALAQEVRAFATTSKSREIRYVKSRLIRIKRSLDNQRRN